MKLPLVGSSNLRSGVVLSREVLELVSEVREVIAAGISDASCAIGVIDGVGEEDVLSNLNG